MMVATVIADRLTAQFEGEVVVFLIGMRINRVWKIHKWLPVALAMPRMLRELKAAPDSGLLGVESWIGNPTKLTVSDRVISNASITTCLHSVSPKRPLRYLRKVVSKRRVRVCHRDHRLYGRDQSEN